MGGTIGGEPPDDFVPARYIDFVPDHHRHLNKALQDAVNAEQDEGVFEVVYLVSVKHNSPGWVDGYKVELRRR